MRTLVWGWGLASGNRERGKAAGCEGDGTDERDPLVSVRVRGRGQHAPPARARVGRAKRAGLRADSKPRCSDFFFFFLCKFLLNV
jgi:hypothetical protein